MRKIASYSFVLLLCAFFMTSCNKENISNEEFADYPEMANGLWQVGKKISYTFDNQGNVTSMGETRFGEHTPRGECSFEFTDQGTFTMVDRGELETMSYTIEDNVINLSNGSSFGIRSITENNLELVISASEEINPCVWTVAGDVLELSRSPR